MKRIVFVHWYCQSQFIELHNYFNKSGLAESYLLCNLQDYEKYKNEVSNLYPFFPDGDPFHLNYYYSGWAEQGSKISLGILGAVKQLSTSKKIDVIIAYHSLGSPNLLFDETDIPIITYIEFPSYRHYGWDPKYPPNDQQRINDKGLEMLSYYQALKSDLVICPTEYIKKMLPEILHDKIVVQQDGFNPEKIRYYEKTGKGFEKKNGLIYIGFQARVLSSSKGYEQFIVVSKKLLERHKNIHFIVSGSAAGETYGYENLQIEKTGQKMTFKDYILEKEKPDISHYTFLGYTGYEKFSNNMYDIDFFLYPLQTGSNNWGLMEQLLRGKIVVASNRCFVPEYIKDGVNGFLCDYEDIDSWVNTAGKIIENPDSFKYIGENAREYSKRFYIQNVAQNYFEIIGRVLKQRLP